MGSLSCTIKNCKLVVKALNSACKAGQPISVALQPAAGGNFLQDHGIRITVSKGYSKLGVN